MLAGERRPPYPPASALPAHIPYPPLLLALQCVHLVISAAGAAAIDTLDATFALTNDQTAGSFYAGVTGAQPFGAPYSCTSSMAVATLLAGTDATAGYANINLTGTAFAVSSTTCSGAASCTCSGSPVCGSFAASTYTGAGVVQYTISGQAAVLMADGLCAGWLPTSAQRLIPLDGIVGPTNAACGGIPGGLSGSSCMTLPVARNGTTQNQTFWVSASGAVYLPLSARTPRPFPTISAVNAGAAAPNTVSYSNMWYSYRSLLTA